MKIFQIILALGFPTEKMISNIFLHFTFTSCCLLYDEVLCKIYGEICGSDSRRGSQA